MRKMQWERMMISVGLMRDQKGAHASEPLLNRIWRLLVTGGIYLGHASMLSSRISCSIDLAWAVDRRREGCAATPIKTVMVIKTHTHSPPANLSVSSIIDPCILSAEQSHSEFGDCLWCGVWSYERRVKLCLRLDGEARRRDIHF
jgi:hypothetical protein